MAGIASLLNGLARLFLVISLATTSVLSLAQRVQVLYMDASIPLHIETQRELKSRRLLEGLGEMIASRLVLKKNLLIVSRECGYPNAYYFRDNQAIVLCLELMGYLAQNVTRLRLDELDSRAQMRIRSELVAGALAFLFLHEIGHAVIDIHALPIFGREEDIADLLSIYLLLETVGLPDSFVAGALWFFSSPQGSFTQRHFSAQHSLNPQRRVNLACVAYGRDPNRYSWLLPIAGVPADRAVRCPSEYQQLRLSVQRLLGPNLRD